MTRLVLLGAVLALLLPPDGARWFLLGYAAASLLWLLGLGLKRASQRANHAQHGCVPPPAND